MAGKDSFNEITGVFQELNNVKKETLRGGRGPTPKSPRKPMGSKPDKPPKTPLKTTFRQETKFQMLRLIKSGRTLREAKALTKALAVGLTPEYLAKKDEKDLLSIEGGLDRLTRTRAQQIDFLKVKFKPKTSFPIRKEEFLARWLMDQPTAQPIDWKRDGNLVRKAAKPTPSRPGSSKGKIGKTRVIGAERTLRDFQKLVRTLRNLQKRYGKGNTAALKNAMKSIRKGVRTIS